VRVGHSVFGTPLELGHRVLLDLLLKLVGSFFHFFDISGNRGVSGG